MNSSCIGGRYLTMKRAISLVSGLTTDLPRGGIWQENTFTVCHSYSSAEMFDIRRIGSSDFDDHRFKIAEIPVWLSQLNPWARKIVNPTLVPDYEKWYPLLPNIILHRGRLLCVIFLKQIGSNQSDSRKNERERTSVKALLRTYCLLFPYS